MREQQKSAVNASTVQEKVSNKLSIGQQMNSIGYNVSTEDSLKTPRPRLTSCIEVSDARSRHLALGRLVTSDMM